MSIPRKFIVAILALAMTVTTALAAETIRGFSKADTQDKFEQLVTLVQQEMEGEGRYRFVSPTDRVVVERRFADMRAIFEKTDSVSAMGLEQKTALFNAQEKINGILAENDADRTVCENKKIIGSNIPRRTCITYGELKQQENDSKAYMAERGKVPCVAGKDNTRFCKAWDNYTR